MTTQEHTHDSAMSGEVKEKWEDSFDELFVDYPVKNGIEDKSKPYINPDIEHPVEGIKKFISHERSLAQQEILDRANEMIFDHEWFDSDGTEDDADFVKHIRLVLSTLKDTNI